MDTPKQIANTVAHRLKGIEPANIAGDFSMGTLHSSVKEITKVLGFKANIEDDPYKVKYSWGFSVGGKRAGIWDYKGSHKFGEFSVWDPDKVLVELFGKQVVYR